jgi:hypothetical protein
MLFGLVLTFLPNEVLKVAQVDTMPSLFIRSCPQDTVRLDSDFATFASRGIKDYQVQMRFVLLNSPQFIRHVLPPFGRFYRGAVFLPIIEMVIRYQFRHE